MTTIPIVWGNLNPDAIARGYWDTSIIEAIADQELWRPANGFTFVHYAGWDPLPPQRYAIVVIPARHNVAYVSELNRRLNEAFDAVLLVLAGDEEHAYPWRDLKHDRMAIWVMTPDPIVHADIPSHRRFGTMFPPFTRATLDTLLAVTKSLDWYFRGQDTHARRHACLDALDNIPEPNEGYHVGTAGFTQGLLPETFTADMAFAKVAPCPSGPATPDTFRLWEALEAGCIPLADGATPKGPQPNFWPFLLGEDTPFPVVTDWSVLPILIPHLLSQWPANANRISAWYQDYRRKLVYRFHDDVRDVLGAEPSEALLPEDRITALIPTSPIPSHPSTAIIEETVGSIREGLGDCEIIIGIDGVRPEQENFRAAYEEYVRRLLWKCNHVWHNVVPVRLDHWGHQANVTRAMLERVRTDVVLFVEHDTPLRGGVPFGELASIVMDGELANVIRLSHEASVLEPHEHLFLDDTPTLVHEVPLLRTVQWSQRPHLARTDWYRWLIERYFAPESRVMVEDTIYGVLHGTWVDRGVNGWREWRVWMYAPPGNMTRSVHLDGRAGEEKHEMTWAYPGDEVPEFAPNPIRDDPASA